MNKRKNYTKQYNSRPESKLKRKLWRNALIVLRKNNPSEFQEIYSKLLKENGIKRKYTRQ